MTKKRIGVFPGSFDPFTNGHKELVEEALKIFDQVTIAIGQNTGKQNMFTAEERREMIVKVFNSDRVHVVTFEGLIANFVTKMSQATLIRGLRSEIDFTYELPMAITNKLLSKGISTIFFPTNPANRHISSSLVREISYHHGDISSFVPPTVLAAIQNRSK